MKKTVFTFMMFFFIPLVHIYAEDPWGMDAELITLTKKELPLSRCRTPILGEFGERMIRFHKEVISPA